MRIWTENDGADILVHFEEPQWSEQHGRWISKGDGYDFCHRGYIKYTGLPLPDYGKNELHEVDLSGKPKIICVWVPAED